MARKKRIGRPPKPVEERKAAHFTFRMREGMRDQLQQAAADAGRSVSEEIEYRLYSSLRPDPLLALVGIEAQAIRLIAAAMQLESAAEDGAPWHDDRAKAEAVRTAAHLIVASYAGLPQEAPPLKYDDTVTELRPAERGRALARFLLERSGRKLSMENEEVENEQAT